MVDKTPIMFYPWKNECLVTWKADEDMEHEFFPQQIAYALRLSNTAKKRNCRFLPTMLGFYKIENRIGILVAS